MSLQATDHVLWKRHGRSLTAEGMVAEREIAMPPTLCFEYLRSSNTFCLNRVKCLRAWTTPRCPGNTSQPDAMELHRHTDWN